MILGGIYFLYFLFYIIFYILYFLFYIIFYILYFLFFIFYFLFFIYILYFIFLYFYILYFYIFIFFIFFLFYIFYFIFFFYFFIYLFILLFIYLFIKILRNETFQKWNFCDMPAKNFPKCHTLRISEPHVNKYKPYIFKMAYYILNIFVNHQFFWNISHFKYF